MLKKRSRPAPLLTLHDLHIFTLTMLVVAMAVMVTEMLANPVGCTRWVVADIPQAYNAIALRRAVRFDAMIVTIFRDGKVYFGSDRASPATLPELIRKSLNEGAERKVYLKVDQSARYGVVSRVLAEVRSAGIENVAFLVEKRKPKEVGWPWVPLAY